MRLILLIVSSFLLVLPGCRNTPFQADPPPGRWEKVAQVRGSVYELNFLTPELGWVVTHLEDLSLAQREPKPEDIGWAIYQSQDGGRTLTQLETKRKPQLRMVKFVDANVGYALDVDNAILRTGDGGKTWQVQRRAGQVEYRDERYKSTPVQKIKEPIDDLVVVNADTAFAYGGGFRNQTIEQPGVLLKTTNGGQTWQVLDFFFQQRLGILYFINPTHGWAYDAAGTLYQTTDGGQRWVILESGKGANVILSIFFLNPEEGWLVGKSGEIRHTTDGGKSWQKQKSPSNDTLRSVYFVDPQRGWIGGTGGTVLATNNGGARWYRQAIESDETIVALDFSNDRAGWAAGHAGSIFKFSAE